MSQWSKRAYFTARIRIAGECWEWTGSKYGNGYGRMRGGSWDGQLAHRVSYEEHKGPIPDGLVIDHLCRNRACVNPAHLEAVTTAENLRRGVGFVGQQVKRTHCPQGHEYSAENTVVYYGSRYCRTCKRAHFLKHTEKRKREQAEGVAA